MTTTLTPKPSKSLKQLFGDPNYAWQLLEAQVKLETSQAAETSGEDISALLQLYMRGVEKMNTLVDLRESFFKNKVTALMSRPLVIKVLNKPMTKKSQPAMADCSSPVGKGGKTQQINNSGSAKKTGDAQKELQLKQKKQSLQMRLAYSAEENNPDALKKMLAQHSQKQVIIEQKIYKIVDSHEQRLKKRISQRKMRTITAKSKSQAILDNLMGEEYGENPHGFEQGFNNIQIRTEARQGVMGNQQQPSHTQKIQEKNDEKMRKRTIKKSRSLQIKPQKDQDQNIEKNRKISLDYAPKIKTDPTLAQLIKQKRQKKKKQIIQPTQIPK